MASHLSHRQSIVSRLTAAAPEPPDPAEAAEWADLLAVLDQWQSGTLHGIPPFRPDPDPARPLGASLS